MIDDDDLIRETMEIIGPDFGIEVITSGDGASGVLAATKNQFDLILCDIRMPGLNGAQTIAQILESNPEAKVLVLTAFPGDPLVQNAIVAGAFGVMKKPFEISKILGLLEAPA